MLYSSKALSSHKTEALDNAVHLHDITFTWSECTVLIYIAGSYVLISPPRSGARWHLLFTAACKFAQARRVDHVISKDSS